MVPMSSVSAFPAALRHWPGWVWMALFGLSMAVGGSLVWVVAITRIMLPYDEALTGLTREGLAAINPWILPFMAHDRVALAGTLIALGVLYTGLALGGLREGVRAARGTLLLSAGVGFASFFLFLGTGYFDPLHAFYSLVVLLPFGFGLAARFTPGVAEPARPRLRPLHPGQALLMLTGLGLTLAGATISLVGATGVFVPSDLVFLHTTREALAAINPRLVPLIAHDRAGFGGALLADGLAVLGAATLCWRPGARWLWWTLLGAGVPGFVAAIGVHVAVGYLDVEHLAPALLGCAVYALGLAASYRPLCRPVPSPTPRRA